MASTEEEQMRVQMEAGIIELLPGARIIHELPVWGCRADIAAVTEDRLLLFELKSSKDTLSRLNDQMRTFNACAHHAIAVIDNKFFDTSPYTNGGERFASPDETDGMNIWAYPGPPEGLPTTGIYEWKIPSGYWTRSPDPMMLLGVLFAGEQRSLLREYELPVGSNQHERCVKLALELTGREISAGVCERLRERAVLRGTGKLKERAGLQG